MSLLQKAYIQKSKIFLLPLTGLRKDRIYRPTNTYISGRELISKQFPSGISIQDETLIVLFSKDYERKENESVAKLKVNSPFGNWEKYETETLFSNRNFSDFYEAEDDYIYTFNLSDWSKDWTSFLNGSYSNFTSDAKELIIQFRWKALAADEQKKLYCYLYPYKDECISCFAKELGMRIEDLAKSHELCSKPQLELEDYKYEKINTENLIENESED